MLKSHSKNWTWKFFSVVEISKFCSLWVGIALQEIATELIIDEAVEISSSSNVDKPVNIKINKN